MTIAAKLSRKFYDRFGEDVANELVDLLNVIAANYKSDLREINDASWARFDARLEQRIAELRADMHEFRTDVGAGVQLFKTSIGADMQLFKTSIGAEMQDFKTSIGAEMQALKKDVRVELKAVETRLIIWMFALILASALVSLVSRAMGWMAP